MKTTVKITLLLLCTLALTVVAHGQYQGSDENVDFRQSAAMQWATSSAARYAPEAGVKGDANGDGTVSVADLSLMASHILGEQVDLNAANADVNADGGITVADLAAVASIILNPSGNDEGDKDKSENCFVLWHKEGYVLRYLFAEKPVVSFVDEKIKVQDNTVLAEYDFEAISKMTYEHYEASDTDSVKVDNDSLTQFVSEGRNLIFQAISKPLQIEVKNENGVLIDAFTVGATRKKSLPVKSLPRGVNRITVNGATYKIDVR